MVLSYLHLSHDVASGSEITPCNKIDKPLVVSRLVRTVMTPIITLRNGCQYIACSNKLYTSVISFFNYDFLHDDTLKDSMRAENFCTSTTADSRAKILYQ